MQYVQGLAGRLRAGAGRPRRGSSRGHGRLWRGWIFWTMRRSPNRTLPNCLMSVCEMGNPPIELQRQYLRQPAAGAVRRPGRADRVLARRPAIRVSRLDHNEPELNCSPPGDPHDTTTPGRDGGKSAAALMLGEVLSPGSRQHLTEWLVGCKTGEYRLGVGSPGGLEGRGQDRQQWQGCLRRHCHRLV